MSNLNKRFPAILSFGLVIALYTGLSQSTENVLTESDLEVITLLGDKAKALPEFELIDHNKQKLANTRLEGKWTLMFFGYISCPDVCPTTLGDVSRAVNAIEDSTVRDALSVYFVSVDPQRDKPERLASYMSYFNPEFIGATAENDKLKILTSALGIAHKIKKKSDSDLDYSVSHSGFVALINPQVMYSGLFFTDPGSVQAIARDLGRLVKQTGG